MGNDNMRIAIQVTLLGGIFQFVGAMVYSQIPALSFMDDWSAYFGNRPAMVRVREGSRLVSNGDLEWSLSVDHRTLTRGVAMLSDGIAQLEVHVPAIKEGVVMDTQLSVYFSGGPVENPITTNRCLHIFGDNPFYGHQAQLKNLNIKLFDPIGNTAATIASFAIPFASIQHPSSLVESPRGLLIVGEGVVFEDYPGLFGSLCEVAISGHTIVCLAPSSGQWVMPGTGDAVRPEQMVFCATEIIKKYDRKLDAKAWPPDGRVIARTMVMKSVRESVVGEITEDSSGWPWIDMVFSGGGRLVFCGFAIISKWETGPVPRHLFWHILKDMDPSMAKEQ